MSYPAVLLLVAANLRAQAGRFAAACVAIAFAAALLLSALIGQQVVRNHAPLAAQALMGPNEAHLAATDTVHPLLDKSLVELLRADPRVARLSTAVSVRAVDLPGIETGELDAESFYNLEGAGMGGWIPGRRDGFLAWSERPQGELVEGRWPRSEGVDPVELVVPSILAWGQPIGSWRRLESDTGVHAAQVVGVLKGDMAMVSSPQGVRLASRQISLAAAEKLAGKTLSPSDARIALHRAEDMAAFLDDWRPRVGAYPGRIEMWDDAAIEEAGLRSPAAESARLAVRSAVLLASACVVCIALSVQGNAVRERASQSSLLRSLGATRAALSTLVLTEAVLLAAVSLFGAVLMVWLLLSGLAAYLPMLRVSATPDVGAIVVTGGVTLAGVLLGAAWPAIVASRRLPGQFSVEQGDPDKAARLAKRAAAVGVMVAALTATVLSFTPTQSLVRADLLNWLGVPGLALTALLLTPLIVRLSCQLFVRPVAKLTLTEPLVLADQVAADGARSTGSVVAIAIGLGGFIWMLCWGASMLESFVIDPAIPRWLVSIQPFGLDQDETEKLLAAPTFRDYHPLTLVDTHLNGADEATPTLVMGVELGRSLSGQPKGLPFKFVAGKPAEAAAQLSRGGACLVDAWYAASHHTKVGDRLAVAAPSADGRAEREYRVAGIVELQGWRMATKLNKVRLHGDKHQAMLVLDANAVRLDFPVAFANYLLGDAAPIPEGGRAGFRDDLPRNEAYAMSRVAREAVESAVASVVDLSRPVEHRPDDGAAVTAAERVVQVDDLDRTRSSLRGDWGGAAVKRMGQAPLLVLALSLFSVSGALVGSFRSRSRELGVLRSCGLNRSGLARLAVAEALLLGVVAVPVASLLGGVGAWMMLEVASVVGFRLDFAGIQPEFIVPWPWLWPGLVVTAAVCCVAALGAAARVGRTSPASLVSASRL